MLLDKLIPRVRDHYVELFRAFVKREQSSGKRGSPEVKLQVGESADSPFQQIYCVDYVENDAGNIVAVDMYPDVKLQFQPFEEARGNAQIEVESLCWDNILIRFDGNAPDFAPWFDKWFDPDEKRIENADGLTQMIHSFSVGDRNAEVDFGTAPPTAFFELVDLIIEAGSHRLKLSTTR